MNPPSSDPNRDIGQSPRPMMSGKHRQDPFEAQLQASQQPPQGQIQFSQEDQALIRRLNSESFWQYSLPLAVVFSGIPVILSRYGIIKNSYMGAKAAGGAIFGFYSGKVMYMPQMQEAFMRELPNSEISKLMRKQRGIPEPEFPDVQDQQPSLRQEQPHQDDMSYFASAQDQNKKSDSGMTYDNLREANRQKYQSQGRPGFIQAQPGQVQQPPADANLFPTQPPSQLLDPPNQEQNFKIPDISGSNRMEEPAPRRVRKGTNKYGDEGFE